MTALVIIILIGGYLFGGDGLGSIFIDGVAFEGPEITARFANNSFFDVFLTIAIVLCCFNDDFGHITGIQSWKLFGRGKLLTNL